MVLGESYGVNAYPGELIATRSERGGDHYLLSLCFYRTLLPTLICLRLLDPWPCPSYVRGSARASNFSAEPCATPPAVVRVCRAIGSRPDRRDRVGSSARAARTRTPSTSSSRARQDVKSMRRDHREQRPFARSGPPPFPRAWGTMVPEHQTHALAQTRVLCSLACAGTKSGSEPSEQHRGSDPLKTAEGPTRAWQGPRSELLRRNRL